MMGLIHSALLVAVVAGWCWDRRRHRARIAQLEAAALRGINDAVRLRVDNAHLAEWCGRFRDEYLNLATLVDPVRGADLRRKWAALQAPDIVARALERCRHG